MERISRDIIVYIGKLLSQKDLLSLSTINQRYNIIIRKYFNEYLVVFRKNKPILLIKKENPIYNQALECNNIKFMLHRFVTNTQNYTL